MDKPAIIDGFIKSGVPLPTGKHQGAGSRFDALSHKYYEYHEEHEGHEAVIVVFFTFFMSFKLFMVSYALSTISSMLLKSNFSISL